MTAILLSVMVSVMVLVGVAWKTNQPAEATQQQPDDLGLCVPGILCATVTIPIPVTVRATVSVPVKVAPVTVRLPPVTRIISPPPVVKTILQQRTVTLPGPVMTVTRPGLPGATTTATVVVNREIVSNGTAPPVTREVRSTMSAPPRAGQTVTSSATVTPNKEVVRLPGTEKKVTVPVAVGLSLLGLLALMGLGLFLLWLGFILGYRSADRQNTNFLKALRDSIRRPGKHEMSH